MEKHPRTIPSEVLQITSKMMFKHFGQQRNMTVKIVKGTPELNIPDGVLFFLDNKETGKIDVEYLPRTKQPKEPPNNSKQQ